MKPFWLVAALLVTLVAQAKEPPLLRFNKFDDLDRAGIGAGYFAPPSATLEAAPLRRELGRIDRWRYESCRSDAAQASTQHGVNVGQRICREQFGQ